MILPPPGWQRVPLAAILVLPVLVLILLSLPAWITLPFLPADRRKTVLQLVDRIAEWAKSLAKSG
jgi:hypothetical protein